MGQNMSFAGMQNAVQANHSALWAMQMQNIQNIRMENFQTINPLCMAMEQGHKRHETCKHYDRRNGWCDLMEQPAAVAGSYALGGKCGRYEHWATKSQMDVIDAQRVAICEKLERIQETLNQQKAECESMEERLAECCCERGQEKPEPRQIIVDFSAEVDGVQNHLVRERRLYQENERGEWVEIGRTPEQKPLTLKDLYNLAFPVDPIRDYFQGVCKQIEAAHEKRMEILNRVEVVPVERVEIVEPVKSNNKQKAPAMVRGWLDIEKHIADASWKTFLISATLRALTELFESGAKSAVEYIGIMAFVNASLFLIFSAISVPVFVLVCIVREKMFKLERG